MTIVTNIEKLDAREKKQLYGMSFSQSVDFNQTWQKYSQENATHVHINPVVHP